jgi:hypothetical protein
VVSFGGVEEVFKDDGRHASEDGIVAESCGELRFDGWGGEHVVSSVDEKLGLEMSDELLAEGFDKDAGITLDDDAAGIGVGAQVGEDFIPTKGAITIGRGDSYSGM